MPIIFQRELKSLEERLTALSARVEQSVQLSFRAVTTRDLPLAERVRDEDSIIDASEVQLEEECLKILALHQPVAADLRTVVAVLKINNDLERVGDYAVNIADSAATLCELPPIEIPDQLGLLANTALNAFRRSIDSFVDFNSNIAREVCQTEDLVDNVHRSVYESCKSMIHQNTETLEAALHILRISHALERVGDHACNIAEDVIYMQDGGIVRHRS